ncbi:hypothetical protein AB3X96_40700 [Paraburkholderia sp. BR13439]|uniref:hypothetical protein n=2 Tax=unclassified Paraburkholderia TaxID=2615204 RepID=UPI0034CDEB0F
MDNLLFDIRPPDKIVERAMVIRVAALQLTARLRVEFALGQPWNQRSVWRGIRSESRQLGPLSDLTRHDLLAYRQALRQPASDTVGDTTRRLSEALQSRALAVVASLFRYWTEPGYLTANPAAGLVRGGRSRASFAPQRMLPSVLLAACDAWVDEAVAVGDSLVSARRCAIWALYRYAGVRLVELVWSDEAQLPKLDVDDHGSWTLTVLGKGRKTRAIPLPAVCVTVLRNYRGL